MKIAIKICTLRGNFTLSYTSHQSEQQWETGMSLAEVHPLDEQRDSNARSFRLEQKLSSQIQPPIPLCRPAVSRPRRAKQSSEMWL